MSSHKDDPKFVFYQTPERAGRKWISCTKVDTVLTCPWQYHARYELGLPTPPPSKAMLMGDVFDSLCENGQASEGCTKLTQDECDVINDRYENYMTLIPYPNQTQVPIEIDLDYKGWWVQGFIDILPDDPKEPIREVKFSQRPWSEYKFTKKKFQGIVYGVAMGFRPVQFDVSNYETDEIQHFLVEPNKRMWTPARKRFIKAIDVIEGKMSCCTSCKGKGVTKRCNECPKCMGDGWILVPDRTPTPNNLCKGERVDSEGNVLYHWRCDYWDICPEQIKQKEMNEIEKYL